MAIQQYAADGSAETDAHELVEIDRSDDSQRWRYVCPEGHTRWSRTNNHIWCRDCRQRNENGEDVDPEHYEIRDKKTGETIPWSRVRIVDPDYPPMARK